MSKIYTSADQLIGRTPLLELTHIEAAEGLQARSLASWSISTPRVRQGSHRQGDDRRCRGLRQAEARLGHY